MSMSPLTFVESFLSTTGFVGESAVEMATGVARGLIDYLTSSDWIRTIGDTGGAGVGTGNGWILPATNNPTSLRWHLQGGLDSRGINGVSTQAMVKGFSVATTSMIAEGEALTHHGQVASGATIGQFTNLSQKPLRESILTASGFTGKDWQRVVDALSMGWVAFLMTEVQINVVISGTPANSTATGSGSGRII